MSKFNQQVAAITGAGSGMGRSLAVALATRGCHVAIADVSEEGLAGTMAALEGHDVRVSCHQLDVADQAAFEAFGMKTLEAHGKVNMIFNNAGVSVTDSAAHMSRADFEWLMNINFWGVVNGTRTFLPLMPANEPCHIVNTSSIFGTIAVPSQSAYNAAKFAVRGYTYALRMELADSHPHVGVSCVQPGGVKTNIVRKSRYVVRENDAPTHDEIIAKFDSMAGLTADEAATVILRGVEKNKAQILVGRDARFIALLERLAPTGYMKLIRRFMTN
ncbi:MAG: SDR family NAD(P)-dependent oxidoreductase [Pseudomonadales bacterium]|nr:SDR family NAD(P)-dependent oxidoreductase [Pseudomonadales bacterium]